MNNNLLNVVKRIVAEKGENVLADPQKLKPLFSDYAKDEAKEDRVAFGRCIEMGSYQELKNTANVDERRRKKAALIDQLNTKYGIDKPHCSDALDLLEAVIFRQEQQVSPPPQTTAPSGGIAAASTKISKKTLFFGIAGALGAAVGEFISEFLEGARISLNVILYTATWAAFISLGISVGLLAAQSIYLKRKPVLKSLINTAIIGIGLGAVAGGIAQVAFGYTYNISVMVEAISRTICWGIMGLGVGWGVSLFVPNYPKKRAATAGFLGGFIGGAIFRATFAMPFISGEAGRIIGVMVLGLFIGLTISYIEEVLRQAWLTVIWGKNETTTVSLGEKPIIFGSSSEADIYLPKDREPPVRATVQIENSRVVMYDKKTNQRQVLQNGDKVDFEKVSFVVNTKKT